MRSLHIGSAMIDTVTLVASEDIEQASFSNDGKTYLMLETGRKVPALASQPDELELAVAALLIEAARMDDQFDAAERGTIEHLLTERFDLTPDALHALMEAAEVAVRQSTQFFPFTRQIVQRISHEDRAHILEMIDQNDDGLLQTTEVQAHFAELDADGDGNLSGDELPMHGRHERGRHRMAVAMALRAADTDDDHNVTAGEWSAFLATVDADGDGQVTFEEVHARANPDFEPPSLSLDQVNEVFTSLDANGDGTVSEDELPERRDRGPRGHRGPRGPRGDSN